MSTLPANVHPDAVEPIVPQSPKVWRAIGRVLIYAAIIIGAILFAMPFVWMISTSVKPTSEVFVIPPIWIPSTIELYNYVEPWTKLPFVTFFQNSTIVSVVNIIATVLSSSLVAFAFARLRFRFRGFLFVLVLSTMMLPQQVTLVPMYLLFTQIGWVNTLWPLMIQSFFGHAFSIFLLRQYMLTIPREMDEAARLDGASWFQIYWRIIMPLSAPALGVVAIFAFQAHWTEFFNPLIYLNTDNNFTIPLGLELLNSTYTVEIQQTMAMTLLSILPLLIIFFVAQRKFIQGITITGVKG
jgi:ABC-type glycerol-3-phosphate transport system permease component